jgi:FMN-dependent NADH-azoreductase
MANILLITSSLAGTDSVSTRVAHELVGTWQGIVPSLQIVERHLDGDTIPHLTAETLGAIATPPDQRTEAQRLNAEFADRLIEEVEQADAIVLAVPMYNFSIPSTLKAWLDHLARAGRTFRYTETGAQGLLENKKVYVVEARGGFYAQGPASAFDFQEPYLRHMLGFVGLNDVTFIHVEGQKVSPEAAAQGLAAAKRDIEIIVPAAMAA